MIDFLPAATAHDETVRDARLAVLPIGSFEQHGAFLPLATDTVVACAVSSAIAERYPVMSLPPITVSCSHEHAAWRGTVSISSQTLYRIVVDIAESLRRSGVERLALISGHGGNYVLSNVVQEFTAVHGPVMSIFPQGPDWALARKEAGMHSDGHADMHAGELETSILLHAAPELVRPGNATADWAADNRPHLLTSGMREYTTSGVIGYPSLGTPDKGQLCLESLTRSFGDTVRLLIGKIPEKAPEQQK